MIAQHRDRGIAEPLTIAALQAMGINYSVAARTVQALRFLGLIDAQGHHLGPFDELREAAKKDYPQRLGELVRRAYGPGLSGLDPATANASAIATAFEPLQPAGQHEKMIGLFHGLCLEAGIVRPVKRTRRWMGPSSVALGPPERLIAELLAELPPDRRWARERRDRWLSALTAAVDLLIEQVPE